MFIHAAKILFEEFVKYGDNNNLNNNIDVKGEKLKSGDDDIKKEKKNDGCCGGRNK